MRKRKIRKIGNSWFVKLEQTDMRDWELKEGDLVGIRILDESEDD